MTEMVTSSSMSGEGKRSDGLLGESGDERRRSYLAPPALYVTAPLLDSTEISKRLWKSFCDFHRCVISIAASIFVSHHLLVAARGGY
jgi:hypothetical protein